MNEQRIHPQSLLTWSDQLRLYQETMGAQALIRQVEEGRRYASNLRRQRRARAGLRVQLLQEHEG